MATYFDPTNADDKKLIPVAFRTDAELANVAAIVEEDVINEFTAPPPYTNYTAREAYLRDGIVSTEVVGEDVTAEGAPSGAVVPQLRVYLRGYKADADDPNVDPNLKRALKRTIAEVIAWRMHRWKGEPGLRFESKGGGVSKSYLDDVRNTFPVDWDRLLRPFRSDEPAWGI